MALKTKRVIIDTDGRDKGKVFLLTEMPALQAEKWAYRAFLAMSASGLEIPEDVQGAGVAGIAVMGIRALTGLKFEVAEPLLDEMLACVKMCPNAAHPEYVQQLFDGDIEEVSTLIKLRMEVFNLHVDFSSLGALSTLTRQGPRSAPETTSTSPEPSA